MRCRCAGHVCEGCAGARGVDDARPPASASVREESRHSLLSLGALSFKTAARGLLPQTAGSSHSRMHHYSKGCALKPQPSDFVAELANVVAHSVGGGRRRRQLPSGNLRRRVRSSGCVAGQPAGRLGPCMEAGGLDHRQQRRRQKHVCCRAGSAAVQESGLSSAMRGGEHPACRPDCASLLVRPPSIFGFSLRWHARESARTVLYANTPWNGKGGGYGMHP